MDRGRLDQPVGTFDSLHFCGRYSLVRGNQHPGNYVQCRRAHPTSIPQSTGFLLLTSAITPNEILYVTVYTTKTCSPVHSFGFATEETQLPNRFLTQRPKPP